MHYTWSHHLLAVHPYLLSFTDGDSLLGETICDDVQGIVHSPHPMPAIPGTDLRPKRCLFSARGRLPCLHLGPIPLLRVLPGALGEVGVRGAGLEGLAVDCIERLGHIALRKHTFKCSVVMHIQTLWRAQAKQSHQYCLHSCV